MIVHGDCCELLKTVESNSIDLVFADPPFGINESYTGFSDYWENFNAYVKWMRVWLYECARIVKINGSVFVQAPASIASFMHCILGEYSMYFQQEIIWHFNFGPYTDKRFVNAHTRILWFTKSQKSYKWNIQLVNSVRKEMGDKRIHESSYNGMVPYNSVWSIPRVQGNNTERRPFSPNQVPEEILRRIILSTTDKGDLVLDPFCGSGTTHIVCDRLDRECISYEISEPTFIKATEWLQKLKR